MRRPMMVGALVLATGCVTEGGRAYGALPSREQEAYRACYQIIRGRNCQEGAYGAYGDACMRDIGDRYALVPTPEARRETLISLGCPSPIVDSATAKSP